MTANSAIQFLIWLLIAASIVAVLASRLRIPYTVALVIGGLILGVSHHRLLETFGVAQRPNWLTPDVILLFFLPPLLFEGALKMEFRRLRENIVPIALMASIGVLVATLITGYTVHWAVGLPLMVALVFGSIISATDPISVLAIFKEMPVSRRLAVIIEAESLFNDGTAVVLFRLLLAAVLTNMLSVAAGIESFFVEVLGGIAIGLAFGFAISKLTTRIDDPQIEITLTTIAAYGSYLLADSLHMSGVIATVVAGLTIGNVGASTGMSTRTRLALWTFWEYASFLINSVVFLWIGMEVHLGEILHEWRATALAIAAVLLGRSLAVYTLTPVGNRLGAKVPFRWQHVLVWGGMRGSLSLALALSVADSFPFRDQILQLTFGVVAFSIIVQGLTVKPLLRLLRVGTEKENEYNRMRVRQMAISAAHRELDALLDSHLISSMVYDGLRRELDVRVQKVRDELANLYFRDESRASHELQSARTRLIATERGSIEHAVHDGLISVQTAAQLIEASENQMKEQTTKEQAGKAAVEDD